MAIDFTCQGLQNTIVIRGEGPVRQDHPSGRSTSAAPGASKNEGLSCTDQQKQQQRVQVAQLSGSQGDMYVESS